MANVKLLVDIEANSAKLVSEMEKSRKATEGMKGSFESMKSSLSLIKIDSLVNLARQAYSTAQQVYNFAKSVASAANDIERNAKVLNMSTTEYQKWIYTAKMADVTQEDFSMGMRMFTKSIAEAIKGTGDGATALNKLGISIRDSSGNLKNQDTLFLEVIDTLGKYADGISKDIYMETLFGRQWQTLKPLIDQGTEAIKKNMEEAVKLGTVLGDVVIKKGSEAEDTFKRLESQMTAFKISLAPAALAIANLATELTKLFTLEPPTWFKILWGILPMNLPKTVSNLWNQAGVSLGVIKTPEYLEWERQQTEGRNIGRIPTPPQKSELRDLGIKKGAGPEAKDVLAAWEAIVKKNEDLYEIYRAQNDPLYLSLDTIKEMDVKMAIILEDANKVRSSTENWEDCLENIPKGYAVINGVMKTIDDWASSKYRKEVLSLQNLETQIAKEKELRDAKVSLGLMRPAEAGLAGIEGEKTLLADRLALETQRLGKLNEIKAPLNDIYAQEDKITILKREQAVLDASRLRYISETAPAYEGLGAGFQKYVTDVGTKYTQMQNMTNALAKGMEGAFSNFFVSLFDKTKTWQEKMKGLFTGLANAFIKALSDMAAQALVTGLVKNIFGVATGTGWISGLGGTVLAEGGVTGPMLAHYPIHAYQQGGIASSPQLGIFGEGGGSGEAFVPLKSGKIPVEMGDEGRGGQTVIVFNNYAMDAESFEKWVRTKGSKGILGLIADDARSFGTMKDTIRGV